MLFQGELYWTHHWQKNITIPEIKTREKERWDQQDHFPEDDAVSESSSRDYPKLYLVIKHFKDYFKYSGSLLM
jgi:hypothetical protein